MTAAELRAAVRRDIREPSAITISNAQIDSIIALGGDRVWEALLSSDPTKGEERVSIASNTNVFDLPSDCNKIIKVWDMQDNAEDIAAASNAAPIELTINATSTDRSDDQIVRVHDVLGNTAANGVWLVDGQSANTFELYGSTGNASYTSGGKVFQENSVFREMVEINVNAASYQNKWQYFLRSGSIVIDYPTFDNDLILDYTRNYSAITDIPAKYHIALVSYGVIQLLRIPVQQDANYEDIKRMQEYHQSRFDSILESINKHFGQSGRPKRLPDVMHWDYL